MTKALAYIFLTAGMGWTAYFAAPALMVAGIHIAQGTPPDLSLKDFANLGGFAVFAIAMYALHSKSVAGFREDMREERASRERLTAAIAENTAATRQQTFRYSTTDRSND